MISMLEKTKAFQPQIRLPRDYSPTGLADIDLKVRGLGKGTITEVFGNRSSGKTSFILSFLARETKNLEAAAIIDVTDSFDPVSGLNMGIDLNRIFWVRCSGNLFPGLKATDFILHAGGFGFVLLDLGDVRSEIVRKIPSSYWFRFRLAIEKSKTIFLLHSPVSCCGSSCSISMEFTQGEIVWSGSEDHQMLKKLNFQAGIQKAGRVFDHGGDPQTKLQWF